MSDLEKEMDARRQWMEPWYWYGVPSFFKCPVNETPWRALGKASTEVAEIGLIGVPHAAGNGSTERDQHLGPRLVRHVSGRYRRAHQLYFLEPWKEFKILDLGDVPLPEANDNEVSVQHIEDYFKIIDQLGTRPISIGGDHAVTGPILKALGGKEAKLSGGEKIALVHFDAHRDDYEHLDHWLGAKRSAAHWAAYTVREDHVAAEHSIQLGLRGNPMKPRKDPTQSDTGYRAMQADEVFERGLEETIRIMRERVADKPVYITFDLDVLDPADAPGVSNLEAGYRGLRAWEAIKLIQGLRGLNVIGADIVCPMPTMDSPNNITALTTTVIMFEMICLIGDYLKGVRGK